MEIFQTFKVKCGISASNLWESVLHQFNIPLREDRSSRQRKNVKLKRQPNKLLIKELKTSAMFTDILKLFV